MGVAKQNEALLVFRMQGILDRLRQGILECRAGLVEGHSVNREVPAGLPRVPFELQSHQMSTFRRFSSRGMGRASGPSTRRPHAAAPMRRLPGADAVRGQLTVSRRAMGDPTARGHPTGPERRPRASAHRPKLSDGAKPRSLERMVRHVLARQKIVSTIQLSLLRIETTVSSCLSQTRSTRQNNSS